MVKTLVREIEKLKNQLLALCALVEKRLHMAVAAVSGKDEQLADAVLKGDADIDDCEVDLEEECLKLLALHQPVAVDLRYIVAILKINNDLERIGDLAVDIVENLKLLKASPIDEPPYDLPLMAEKVRAMLRKSLDSLIDLDTSLAFKVTEADDEIDALHNRNRDAIREVIKQDPGKAEGLLGLLSVSRHLERIADHATNIAEDVIYLNTGDIVRHRVKEHKERMK